VTLLLSPWQRRVVVRLKTGKVLVWRDLVNETRFIRRVEAALRD
jgi:hypothetical protein